MKDITLRALRLEEAPQWRQLRLDALRSDPAAFALTYEEALAQSLPEFQAQITTPDSPNAIFGAFHDDALIGAASFRVHPRQKMRHKADLNGLFVRKDFRGQGIGAALVRAVIAHARQHVTVLRLSVAAENTQASALYRALGFVPYGFERRALCADGQYYDEELLALYFDDEAA